MRGAERLLELGGLSPHDLRNTPGPPIGEAARAAMYRRAMLDEIGGFDERFGIDADSGRQAAELRPGR